MKARAIVDYRNDQGPFERIEDIVHVYGIGPKTFEALASKIRADPPKPKITTVVKTSAP